MESSLFPHTLSTLVGGLLSDTEYRKVTITQSPWGNSAVIPLTSFLSPPRFIFATLSNADPTIAATVEKASLVFAGVVFQYLDCQRQYSIHSEWHAAGLQPGTTSIERLSVLGVGSALKFKRTSGAMKSLKEDWILYIPKETSLSLNKSQVQPIFNAMYNQSADWSSPIMKQLLSQLQTKAATSTQVLQGIL